MFDLASTGVGWFPQDLAHEFYVLKGLVGLTATVMLIFHMNRSWNYLSQTATQGQRMRYYSLLAFAILVTGASLEQTNETGLLVSYRNLGAFVVTLMLIVAMLISIKEDAYGEGQKAQHRK